MCIMKPTKETNRFLDEERKCHMLKELLYSVRKAAYHPLASVCCLLLAVVIHCIFQPLGLTLLAVPYVVMLTIAAIISLLLIFYQVDNWTRIMASASCIVLVVLFMVEMISVMHSAVAYVQPYDSGYSGGSYSGSGYGGGYTGGHGSYGGGDHEGSGYYPEDDDDCGVCHGTKMCTNCSGNGGSACMGCYSTGDCKYCHGSGVSTGYGVQSKCGACYGTGECKLCDGTGIRKCGICYGRGRCKYCY